MMSLVALPTNYRIPKQDFDGAVALRLLKLLLHGFISGEKPFQFRLEGEETLFFLPNGHFTAIEILLTLI